MTVYVKAQNLAKGWQTEQMHHEGIYWAAGGYAQAYSGITGSYDWTKTELVLEFPLQSTAVGFGVILQGGGGKLWIDGASFEIIDSNVPLTGCVTEAGDCGG